MISQILRKQGSLPHSLFSTAKLNERVVIRDPVSDAIVDHSLDRYGVLVAAYLHKRKINRNQIWPKMYIVDLPADSNNSHLKYQTLFPIRRSMKENLIHKIVKENASLINSAFIISLFSEDYFKEMMDEYVKKVMVSGKAIQGQMQNVQNKIKELYWIYYFGEPISPLQKQIQTSYLCQKQTKMVTAAAPKQPRDKVQFAGCLWRQSDQRLLQEMVNWPNFDTNTSDSIYRPFFQPLLIEKRQAPQKKLNQITNQNSFISNWKFNRQIKGFYDKNSKQYYHWVMGKIFSRITLYCKSLEFTSQMSIPHDYSIQTAILHLHFWLVIDRLKQFKTVSSKYLASLLQDAFREELRSQAATVNLRKVQLLIADVLQMIKINGDTMEFHFNQCDRTKAQPYLGIDALVWSLFYGEKVQRYSEEIYALSQYLIKNHTHMQYHTEEDIFNGMIEFDVFLNDPNYRMKIQRVNPPLERAKYEQEVKSKKETKSFEYSRIQIEDLTDKQTLENLAKLDKERQQLKFPILQLIEPIRRFFKKYSHVKNYDHFSKMDQIDQQNKKQAKTAWKGQKEQVEEVQQQFKDVKLQRIKRDYNKNK